MSSRDSSPSRTASEQTPLLSRTDSHERDANGHIERPDHETDTESTTSKTKRRWPIILALGSLTVAVILALVFGFGTPAAVEEYVKEAVQFEVDSLSIESLTSTGIQARVQGTVWLDASKVHKKPVRDLGRFATYIAKEVESGETDVKVFLPAYDNILLGSAILPPVKMNIRNGHYNWIDIIADLEPGDPEGIRQIARDFLDQTLSDLTLKAVVDVPVRSGLISVSQQVTQFVTLGRGGIPALPKPELESLQVSDWHDGNSPGSPGGIKARVILTVENKDLPPVNLDIPPMSFDVLLPDCTNDYLTVARTISDKISIVPKQNITISATGLMTKLPTRLTSACPHSTKSPLDVFIASYLKGQDATVYIRGGEPTPETPGWLGKLLRDTIVPVPLPVHPFDNMIKNFSLNDVHFSLPESPDGQPEISATVGVLVGLPKDMNFDVDVGRVRADGYVSYEGKKWGKLDLSKWQQAQSRKVDGDLLVESEVVNAPLEITDEDVFAKVIQKMIFKREGVPLAIHALVDVDATTALGTFVISGIPSKGKIFVDPPKTGGFTHKVGEISVVATTESKLTIQAKVNITNPTDYYANIPRVDAELYANGTRVGNAWGGGNIKPGPNKITSFIEWDKTSVGSEFLSQFISGYNVSLTIQPGRLPGLPAIPMNITIPVPHMFGKLLKDTTVCYLPISVSRS